MKKASVYVKDVLAGTLSEYESGVYEFTYEDSYDGTPVSLTMPVTQKMYSYDRFPAFFEGLLPEGPRREYLLREYKIDSDDYFSQLLVVGEDMVGAVTVRQG